MNLFLALFWLLCTVMLLVYEQTAGPTGFRIRLGNRDFSYAWPMLLLVLYNLQRWWRIRSYRAKQRAAGIGRAQEEWQRRHPPNAPAKTPDPNFQFTDEPPTPFNPSINDRPSSNN